MDSEETRLRRLAERVTARRLELGWSKEHAARQANISSITWKRVEDAQPVQDAKLHAVLASLGLNMADLTVDPQASRERLGQLIVARCKELDLDLTTLAERMRVPQRVITDVVAGKPAPREVYTGIESWLQWQAGSIKSVLSGGEVELAARRRQQTWDEYTRAASERVLEENDLSLHLQVMNGVMGAFDAVEAAIELDGSGKAIEELLDACMDVVLSTGTAGLFELIRQEEAQAFTNRLMELNGKLRDERKAGRLAREAIVGKSKEDAREQGYNAGRLAAFSAIVDRLTPENPRAALAELVRAGFSITQIVQLADHPGLLAEAEMLQAYLNGARPTLGPQREDLALAAHDEEHTIEAEQQDGEA